VSRSELVEQAETGIALDRAAAEPPRDHALDTADHALDTLEAAASARGAAAEQLRPRIGDQP